jgi:hypothetical protein
MKITILSISSPNEKYSEMKKIQTEYYSNFPNVKLYFVENDEKQKEKIRVVDNIIYVKGTEHILHILYKTIAGMKWLKNNIDCDWFIRTNLSSIININVLEGALNRFLNSGHKSLFTGPIIMTTTILNILSGISNDIKDIDDRFSLVVIDKKKSAGINDYKYVNHQFVSGSCIILSKDMFYDICDNSHLIKYFLPDDVGLSEYFVEYHPETAYSLNLSYAKDISEPEDDICLYRFHSYIDRSQDIINMEKIVNALLKNEKNKIKDI